MFYVIPTDITITNISEQKCLQLANSGLIKSTISKYFYLTENKKFNPSKMTYSMSENNSKSFKADVEGHVQVIFLQNYCSFDFSKAFDNITGRFLYQKNIYLQPDSCLI